MAQTQSQPRTLTLKEVLEGAERAQQRVSAWPEWKRELSGSRSPESDKSRRASIDKQSLG